MKKGLIFFFGLCSVLVFLNLLENPGQPPNLYELRDGETFEVTVTRNGQDPIHIWYYSNGYVSLDRKNIQKLTLEHRDDFNSGFSSFYSSREIGLRLCVGLDPVEFIIILKRKFWNTRRWKFVAYESCDGPVMVRLLPEGIPQEDWPEIQDLFDFK